MRLRTHLPFAVIVALLAVPAQASAAELLTTAVTSDREVPRICTARMLDGAPGDAVRTVTAPSAGLVTARLTGSAPGDWDLGLFDAQTGRSLGGSASFGSNEVATALVAQGQRVSVQACRLDGGGRTADLSVSATEIADSANPEKLSMVRVSTPTAESKRRLQSLDLDLTEHGGAGFVGVLLHGADDAAKLRRAGLAYSVEIADVQAQSERDRRADTVFADSLTASALPSGRTSYRTLVDYESDLKQLATNNPDIVKPITLPFLSGEGRTVNGIEVTANPTARDGKPVFVLLGLHHAREWPSGENTMEFAFELVNGWKSGNARVRALLQSTRTIFVPVVNVDGFNTSRTFGASSDPQTGRGAPNPGEDDETTNIEGHPNEYRRKNCRVQTSDAYSCAGPAFGLGSTGVDDNRNYGALWGGDGASADPISETWRGPGPFSEPDTKNIRDLVSKRQVVTLITNHTFSDLVLRPPGVAAQGEPYDEGVLKALGDAMAAENGYLSLRGYQLYDTTGTTEDWSYGVTGGLGYTFEIGCTDLNRTTNECITGHFHPPYSEMIKEYEGTTPQADEGGRDGKGNREAYFLALESTANAARHSVLQGSAPPGTVLRLHKEFMTETSPVLDEEGREGDIQTFKDTLDSTMQVPASGTYEWHINPSTRPLVAQSHGSTQSGTPSAPIAFSGDPSGAAPNPNGDLEDEFTNKHVFTVPNDPTKDNALAVVRIDWTTPASDWDMRIFKADASGEPTGGAVASSGQGTTSFEQAKFIPEAGQKYVVVVNNFAAVEPYEGSVSFRGKPPFRASQVESWTMTCETPTGSVFGRRQITIARGERQTVDLCGGSSAGTGSQGTVPPGCVDRSAPISRITRGRTFKVTRTRLSLRGRTRDRGCGRNGAGLVRRVYVAVYRAVRGGCRYLQGNGRLSRRRACNRPIVIRARGTTSWRLSFKVRVPRGRYAVWAVGVDARRNQERGRQRARTVSFRVR